MHTSFANSVFLFGCSFPHFFYQEGNMPLEELLAIYRYEASAGSSIDSSSGDLTDELPDMTLDKVCNNSYMAALFFTIFHHFYAIHVDHQ